MTGPATHVLARSHDPGTATGREEAEVRDQDEGRERGPQLVLRVPAAKPPPASENSHNSLEPGDRPSTDEASALVRELQEQNRLLAHQLLLAQVRAGEISPPAAIATTEDAAIWLAWAHANHHQAGCLCHRCPRARQLVRDSRSTPRRVC
jgi:hypothetical protein